MKIVGRYRFDHEEHPSAVEVAEVDFKHARAGFAPDGDDYALIVESLDDGRQEAFFRTSAESLDEYLGKLEDSMTFIEVAGETYWTNTAYLEDLYSDVEEHVV